MLMKYGINSLQSSIKSKRGFAYRNKSLILFGIDDEQLDKSVVSKLVIKIYHVSIIGKIITN